MKILALCTMFAFFSVSGAQTSVSPSPDDPILMKRANSELEYFLGKVDFGGLPGFKLSIDRALAQEEWKVERRDGGVISITGGSARGVLYGVYDFLEKAAGIRFYSPADTFIPSGHKALQRDFLYSGKPAFPIRLFSLGTSSDEHDQWYGRSRLYGPRGKTEYGAYQIYGSPNRCHTFGIYTSQSDFPKKTECFALLDDNTRPAAMNGLGPGQPCFSNPETRAYFKKKLREFIQKDRDTAKNAKLPAPFIYNVSMNDNFDFCHCSLCRAQWERTGGPGGLELEFINELAESIEKDFPEIIVETFVDYMYSATSSGNIMPRKNVMVQIAQIGHEYSGRRNTLFSLSHPSNAECLKSIRAWGKKAGLISIWDYGIIFDDAFPTPYTEVRGYKDTIHEYVKAGVRSIYLENENHWFFRGKKSAFRRSFGELKNYIFCRLLMNPDVDIEFEISEFMKNCYGPAAPVMNEYLTFLEKRQNSQTNMNGFAPVGRSYLDTEFYLTAERLLNAAEKAAAGNEEYLSRIRRERFNTDYGMLGSWKTHGASFPLTLDQLVARLAGNEALVIRTDFPKNEQADYIKTGEARRAYLKSLIEKKQIPLDICMASLNPADIVEDYYGDAFSSSSVCSVVPDKDSPTGKTFRVGDIQVGRFDKIHTSRKFELGLYDMLHKKIVRQKVFEAQELPQDEKYHWLTFKDVTLSPKFRMWGNFTWCLSPVKDFGDHFDPGMPSRKYDIWISYKLTGPAYVKSSKKENSAGIDRVILVKK